MPRRARPCDHPAQRGKRLGWTTSDCTRLCWLEERGGEMYGGECKESNTAHHELKVSSIGPPARGSGDRAQVVGTLPCRAVT
eukprot:scaffold97318_cov32-Tisochrysis_lutea.AAC.1